MTSIQWSAKPPKLLWAGLPCTYLAAFFMGNDRPTDLPKWENSKLVKHQEQYILFLGWTGITSSLVSWNVLSSSWENYSKFAIHFEIFEIIKQHHAITYPEFPLTSETWIGGKQQRNSIVFVHFVLSRFLLNGQRPTDQPKWENLKRVSLF